ncbi:MAG: hypothetical protein JNN20_05415 [Betaproteobacteria bacterium]|nr:hypothetical protein [Betaproteobacteria bacterium]
MKIAPLNFALILTIIDLVVFSPLIVGSNFAVLGDVDTNDKIVTALHPIWAYSHMPVEWLAANKLFPLAMQLVHGEQWSMHSSVPPWVDVSYYALCFFQTFVIAFAATSLRERIASKSKLV